MPKTVREFQTCINLMMIYVHNPTKCSECHPKDIYYSSVSSEVLFEKLRAATKAFEFAHADPSRTWFFTSAKHCHHIVWHCANHSCSFTLEV